jgi:hypothetical protein
VPIRGKFDLWQARIHAVNWLSVLRLDSGGDIDDICPLIGVRDGQSMDRGWNVM